MLALLLLLAPRGGGALAPPITRRAVLSSGAGAAALATGAAPMPAAAERAGLLDVDVAFELDWRSRPPLPTMARQTLDQDFAVCLMRSSYNVVDGLDFVAMDEFQKVQYLTRQDEWERYLAESRRAFGAAPEQGQLSDPAYFDFISFVQYRTINAFLARPVMLFDELVTAEGARVTVARNATSVADADLGAEHDRRVGDAALDFVLNRFDKLGTARVVVASGLSDADVVANVGRLATLLAVLGFCLDSSVSFENGVVAVRFVAPANYWGLKCLARRTLGKRPLANDFGAKVVSAYLARVGAGNRSPATTTFDATSYTHAFALARGRALPATPAAAFAGPLVAASSSIEMPAMPTVQ